MGRFILPYVVVVFLWHDKSFRDFFYDGVLERKVEYVDCLEGNG